MPSIICAPICNHKLPTTLLARANVHILTLRTMLYGWSCRVVIGRSGTLSEFEFLPIDVPPRGRRNLCFRTLTHSSTVQTWTRWNYSICRLPSECMHALYRCLLECQCAEWAYCAHCSGEMHFNAPHFPVMFRTILNSTVHLSVLSLSTDTHTLRSRLRLCYV